MIVLAVFTDGRDDLLARTLASAEEHLQGPITRRVIFDDTGDADHVLSLYRRYAPAGYALGLRPDWAEGLAHQRLGFGGAIRTAWAALSDFSRFGERFVFHLEDDFTFNRYVDLAAMVAALEDRPYLAQMALRRQAWNATERAAGGVVEANPDAYTVACDVESVWLEHRLFFTTNPSLYRRTLCEQGWPEGDHSEGLMTHRLLEDPAARFGYWGARDSGEWVTHIGKERVGVGY